MIGSTFIFSPEPSSLQSIAEVGVEALDDFDRVDMNTLLTLDFTATCTPAAISWTDGEPVLFDESTGIVICKVSPAALRHVVEAVAFSEPEQATDLQALRAFVARHGDTCIYELSTF